MLPRRVLGDVGLALLAVVALAFAAHVVLRDPSPPVEQERLGLAAVASASPSPSAGAVDALVLRSPGTPAQHVVVAARILGWKLTGAALTALPAGLASDGVVVVQASGADDAQVKAVLTRVHASAPQAELVLLAPLTGAGDAATLRALAAGAGAQFFDPLGLGWTTPGSAGAAQEVGTRLADVLA